MYESKLKQLGKKVSVSSSVCVCVYEGFMDLEKVYDRVTGKLFSVN